MSNKIESTRTYGSFQFMKGNRRVDTNHVKKLKREMANNPELLASNPIMVNEHLFIIDGQHRFTAAKELGHEIFYIVAEGTSIHEARHLNTTQRRWQMIDFAQSYADSGYKDYIDFLHLHKQYPLVSLSILRLYCVGYQVHDMDGIFRRGEFEVYDMDETVKHLDALTRVVNATHVKMNMPMATSLLDLMKNNEDFDIEAFIKKLEDREGARELFQPLPSRRGCMRSIEAVYNYHSPKIRRLY